MKFQKLIVVALTGVALVMLVFAGGWNVSLVKDSWRVGPGAYYLNFPDGQLRCLGQYYEVGPIRFNKSLNQAQADLFALPTVVLGRGISNQAELGMTLEQVRARRPDLLVQTAPAQNPLVKAAHHASIPALGLSFIVRDPGEEITELILQVNANATSNVFRGRLSCGLDFGASTPVLREDIVKALGEPADPGITNVLSFLQAGKSVVWNADASTEILYYPASGVCFRLVKEAVDIITLVPTVPLSKQELQGRLK